MTKNYYSTTAYDSTKPRQLAPLNRTDMGVGERTARSNPLFSNGSQCREYLAGSIPVLTVLELQGFNKKEHQEVIERKLHEKFQWQTGKNKAALVDSIGYVAGWFWFFGGIGGGLVTGLILEFEYAWFLSMLITFVAPFTIWSLAKISLKLGWFKDENNIVFNRRTGMVSFPRDDETISLPFDEFDPYLSTSMTTAASINQFLRLVHRYSDTIITNPSSFSKSWELFSAWEEAQQFMDISKPLPDIPSFDFAREHDPVSATYDKKYNRPKDYWKNLAIADVQIMWDASLKARKTFPWESTREQALQSGWKPSGVGEGAWRKEDTSNVA